VNQMFHSIDQRPVLQAVSFGATLIQSSRAGVVCQFGFFVS
jgi:hypothetical protein